MNTVFGILATGRLPWRRAALILVCFLVIAVPVSAQESVAQEPASAEQPLQQASDALTSQPTPPELSDAQVLVLVFAYSLLALAVMFAVACLLNIWSSKAWPEIESHWGGLGGGLGGVRISPSLLFLAAAIAFAAILASIQDDVIAALEARAETPVTEGQDNSDSGESESDADVTAENAPDESAADASTTPAETTAHSEDAG